MQRDTLPSATEATPLLPSATSLSEQERRGLRIPLNQLKSRVAYPLLVGFDRMIRAVNTMALPRALIFPILAYPDYYPKAYRVASLVGMPLCLAELALDVAASRQATVTVRGQTSRLDLPFKIFSSISNGANADDFTLGAAVAVYLAIYNALYDVGNNQVNALDSVFLAGFVLPAFLVGVAYGVLEFTKSAWSEANTKKAKAASGLHAVLNTIYNSGNINSFELSVLAPWHLGETGDVDPYARLGIYSLAFVLGLTFVVLDKKYPMTKPHVNRILKTTSAIFFTYNFFSTNSKNLLEYGLHPHTDHTNFNLGKGEYDGSIALYAILALSAFVSGFIYPPKPTSVESLDLSTPRARRHIQTDSPGRERESGTAVPHIVILDESRTDTNDADQASVLPVSQMVSVASQSLFKMRRSYSENDMPIAAIEIEQERKQYEEAQKRQKPELEPVKDEEKNSVRKP